MSYVYKENNRKIYIDFLKIFSILLVFFNHTGECGFWYFATESDSVLKFLYMIPSVICKIAVPLFLMSSGAVLLGKNEKIKDVCVRVFKYAIVLLVVSGIYFLLSNSSFILHKS